MALLFQCTILILNSKNVTLSVDYRFCQCGPHCCLLFVIQGYGDNKPKSSTTAQEVRTLDGIYIEKVERVRDI